MKRYLAVALVGCFALVSGPAGAESAPHHAVDAHGHHGDAHGSHAEGAHGHHGHVPQFSDINWFTGLIGEKEGVEPGLLWRAPGTPPPLGALILNAAVLFFLLIRFGGPAIKQGLIDRKKRVASDIEAARAMKIEAEAQLAHYEQKLSSMAAEMERIQAEMREQARAERERILAEVEGRRQALEREARVLVSQELNAARELISQKVVRQAVQAARESIVKSLNAEDQERLAQEQLSSVESVVRSEVQS